MWLKKGAVLIAVLLIAVSLTGCKTDDSFNGATDSSASNGAPTAAPWWKGTPARTEPTSDAIAPSFNSAAKKTDNKISPRQDAEPVRDANVARTADSLASVATPGTNAYRIGPLDVLDISVFQAPDLSKSVEVADNGTIDVPLVGETRAAGKTTQELQRDLNSKLGTKYLQNPQVTVVVKEFNSSRVTVSGAVKNPGVFPYKGQTLMQLVAMSGGLAPESNSMVLVLRQNNGKRMAAKFNVAEIQSGGSNDPTMQSGDVIVADTSAAKTGLNYILKVIPLAGFAALL